MKTTFLSLISAALTICNGLAQPAGEKADGGAPETAAIIAGDRAYEAAYAKGDAVGVAAFFTEDAEYTSDDGRTFSGRSAIEDILKSAFALNKGAKIAISADSVKVLTPEVVVEKGSTLVTSGTGEVSGALYTAVYVKKDGKWKISQLVETPQAEAAAADHLAELGWLIGNWQEADKDSGLTIHSTYQWAKGGNFISRNVAVKRGEEALLEGWQIIGWDPVAGGIRSWTFDDEGGYSEGRWTREGQRWLVREAGYSSDGSRTSADQTITKASDDKLFWQSDNRTLDGDPQPGIARIEITRVKGE